MANLCRAIMGGSLDEVKKHWTHDNYTVAVRFGMDPIVIASLKGEENIVQFMLSSRTWEIESKSKEKAVMMLAECGHAGILRLFLESGVNKNMCLTSFNLKHAQLPLHTAAIYGNAETVEVFLEFGFSPDDYAEPPKFIASAEDKLNGFHDSVGEISFELPTFLFTALEYACLLGHVEVVQILLRNHQDPWIFSKRALHLAATERKIVATGPIGSSLTTNSHAIVVQLLLDKGFDVDSVADGETPLCVAAKFGCISIVETLLRAGANVNKMAECRRAPLHFAVASHQNQEEIVNLLLANGAEVTAVDFEKSTLLHYASINGNAKMVQLLLDRGLDPNARDSNEDTPLHKASNCLEIWENLISYGAQIEVSDCYGLYPLHYACGGAYLNVVKMLLKKGSRFDLISHVGETPLNFAALCFRVRSHDTGMETALEVCRELLRAGADPNLKGPLVYPPIFHAVHKMEDTSLTDLLVSYGADVNDESMHCETPLRRACSQSSIANIIALLDYGAQLTDGEKLVCLKLLVQRMWNSPVRWSPLALPLDPFELHFVKLNTALLCSSGAYVKHPLCSTGITELSEFETRCLKEVDKLKQNNIPDTSVTHYDLLRKPSPVYRGDFAQAVSSLVPPEWNLPDQPVADFGPLPTEYPIYWRLLRTNILRGLKRGKLFDDCHFAMRCIPHFNLPLLAVDKILSLLTDQELMNLGDAAPRRVECLKRKREHSD